MIDALCLPLAGMRLRTHSRPLDVDYVRAVIRAAFETLRALPDTKRPELRLAYGVGLVAEPALVPDRPDRIRLTPSARAISSMDAVLLSWLPLLRDADPRVMTAVVQHAKGRSHAAIGRGMGCTGQFVGQLERRGLQTIFTELRRAPHKALLAVYT